jgi:hypothetical protein
MAAARAAMTVGGGVRTARLLPRFCAALAMRAGRRAVRFGLRHCEVRSGSCTARTKSAGDAFRTMNATQSSWGLARGERVWFRAWERNGGH